MSDTSGPTFSMPFASYDHDESCWRTSQGTLVSDSDRFSGTWPRSGMTRAGHAYELPTLELPTVGSESSSLLPTPVADHSRGLPQPGTDYASLPNVALSLLPTPMMRDYRTGYRDGKASPHRTGSAPLNDVAQALLPTPRAQNGEARNQTCWLRPLDEPQNLKNALARLPGVSTPPPSTDGSGSSDDLPHRQLSLDDPAPD